MQAKLPSIAQTISNWWSRHTLAQRFATLTAVLIISSLAIFGTVLVGVSSRIVDRLESDRVTQQLNAAADLFSERVQHFSKIPLILSGTPPIARIVDLSAGGKPRVGESLETWRARLASIFQAFVEATPSVKQVRLIGVADGGREIVRVDRAGDAIKIIDEADLQRKGDRPYFREALRLGAGDTYLSPMDANVENGVVQRPFQPMIRAVTPIYTEQGRVFGVIAVNAAPEAWLRDISSEVSGDFMVANQNGDYIFRSDGGPIFGSIDGSGSRFRHDRRQLEAILNLNNSSSMSFSDGKEFVGARRVVYKPANPVYI
jgi:two-component system sensor histidine kinase/response regulator